SNLLSVYLSLIHPEDYTRVRRKIVNAQKAPELSQERMVRPDGKIVYINQFRKNIYDENGELVKVIGISQDVTEEVLNSERIKKNEERFSALVQNISDMIAILDPAGTINYVSPSSYAIIGYQPEELIGKNVFNFLHDADVAELMAELGEVAKGTNTGEPTLHRFKAKDGHWVWLESKGSNMIKDMHVGGLVINARNVTERVHLEEQLAIEQQKYQRAITSAVIQAQEAERSEVGRELHDNVNQVLTTVKLYTEMVHDGLAGGRELLEKSAYLLQSCIDEIRSISKRLSAPTLGEISLTDSIKELMESVNLTNRIEIVYKGQEMTRLKIPKDIHLAIYRIIQEQLNNILKYAEASLVTINLKKSGGYLVLEMTDNGKGFDTNAKRSGIGITNMQTRAENLGGHFQISSAMGKGCRLNVRFPLTVDQETLPQEA
ncbi:MAG TPA: PAS domain S-box protein, partial [Flavisolibacter sp.]|nr:PAS domain S-box protein [Flavisolibacter sp.]